MVASMTESLLGTRQWQITRFDTDTVLRTAIAFVHRERLTRFNNLKISPLISQPILYIADGQWTIFR
jgi:hypothetical protein